MSSSAAKGNVDLQIIAAGHLGAAGDVPTTRVVGPFTVPPGYSNGIRILSLDPLAVPDSSEILLMFSPSPYSSTPAAGVQPFTILTGLNYLLEFGYSLVDGVTGYTGAIDFILYRIPRQT